VFSKRSILVKNSIELETDRRKRTSVLPLKPFRDLRPELSDPTVDGRRINFDTPLGQQTAHIETRKCEMAVPSYVA
jgi:hypothetical protein